MASMTLHVPAELVEVIRDEFVRYRDVQLDVLESRPARDRSAAQRRAANLVCATDIVLHSVPWDEIRPDQSVDLTADGGLLLEIAYGAALGMADRLVSDLHGGMAATFDAHDVIRQTIASLAELMELHARAAKGER